MSSTRILTDKIAWTDNLRSIELLDWETRPEDFDRLCEFIITKFSERDGMTREQLFNILPENEFRKQLRICAERFTEKFQSLTIYVYQRMKHLVLPAAARQKNKHDDHVA
jgi:hypothetical protein